MNKNRWLGVIIIAALASLYFIHPARADTITVDSTNDILDAALNCASVTIGSLPGADGTVSLREAICAANNHSGADTIQFDLGVCFGSCAIKPDSPLPVITGDGTFIDGYSQDGSSLATADTPAVLVVELNGENVTGPLANGLAITSANNQVRGLVINNFLINGVAIAGENATNNVIAGNHIGTDADGEVDMGNGADGVYIGLGASGNLVGGDENAERNVISGNGWEGVGIHASGTTSNTVSGNYIGLDADGTWDDLGNTLYGVRIYGGAANNTIGGESPGTGNLISFNDEDGIRIVGAGTNGNTVVNNYIGLDMNLEPGGNEGHGVYIGDGAQNNSIGVETIGNVIACSGLDGVHITDSGTAGNKVMNNEIGIYGGGCVLSGVRITNGAQYNHVGGAMLETGNVIVYNTWDGIVISGAETMSNTVSANYIGTDSGGFEGAGNNRYGVLISDGASYNIIGGTTPNMGNVISDNGSSGIAIAGSETMSNTISANHIGVDSSGSMGLGNGFDGILITSGARYNVIGGTTPGERNIISDNGEYGVYITGSDTTGNRVIGNFIGTDIAGSRAIGNSLSGVRISEGAHHNWIGGFEAGSGNLISGNTANGVYIAGDETYGNNIYGNTIGADAARRAVLGNGVHGVAIIDQARHNYILDNLIGGNVYDGVYISGPDAPGMGLERNIIGAYYDGADLIPLGNGQHGVHIESPDVHFAYLLENQIAHNALDGVYVDGADVVSILMYRNSIYHNRMGIRLVDGANGGIEAPTISGVRLGPLQIDGMACPDCWVEIFGNETAGSQGRQYLGAARADITGSFSVPIDLIPQPFIYLTATATDDELGTSEFSAVFANPIRNVFIPLIQK